MHSRPRFPSLSSFPSVVVRSSKIEVFGMAVVGRGYNEPERRRVIKTLLDAGVVGEYARAPRKYLVPRECPG